MDHLTCYETKELWTVLSMDLSNLIFECEGHCKRLAPVWRELANAYEGQKEVKIAHVDCTVDKDICTKAEVVLSEKVVMPSSAPDVLC